MPDYTFHSLSDADFEDLTCDLLGELEGVRFQPFTKGRDSGVDLLFGARLCGSTVVQCKHYCGSKFSNLKSRIISEEAPKLAKLKPNRFILTTSLGLTPGNKEELLKALQPYCKGVDDIYGRSDINALLGKYPAIETSHYKLWLTSIPVLERVLKHGSAVWNAMTKEDIERKMSLYVQTGAYDAAADILSKHNYCILSGIPGIGKTTLAQVLVTRLLDDEYELIAVRDDIQEAYDFLDLSKRQVVFYDDFLGQSSISERLGKNEDRGIIRLLNEARKNKQLKVVFTTREYILEDAKRVYEPLNSGDIEIAKCVVKVEDYTRGHRARILYNHIYFSKLDHSFALALLEDRAYRAIIDHRNYSPRIIEWMTVGAGPEGVTAADYVRSFLDVLNNPTKLWQHAFENQISEDARRVLYCLGTVEGMFGIDELRTAWAYAGNIGASGTLSIEAKRAFTAAMKQLDGSFVRTQRRLSQTVVTFHNPSIKDYVRKRIVTDAEIIADLLAKAAYFEQVSNLICLSVDGKVGSKPSGLIPCDTALRDAIRRTFEAGSATYQPVHFRGEMEPYLLRTPSELGEQLSRVVRWDDAYESQDLAKLAREIAAELVVAGDTNKAATLDACVFLESALDGEPKEEIRSSIVAPFFDSIRVRLTDSGDTSDWIRWTTFLRKHSDFVGAEKMAEWRQLAESFCSEELDVIKTNADDHTRAKEWYEEVTAIADLWDVDFEASRQARFETWLEELGDKDEPPEPEADDDWRGSGGHGGMVEDDEGIDHLFDSLNERDTD
ncbi:MAG: ATP-binding protein [Planctomycetes bacterium]|nr:ATP-binding protein [Planctomycetota bacterium]